MNNTAGMDEDGRQAFLAAELDVATNRIEVPVQWSPGASQEAVAKVGSDHFRSIVDWLGPIPPPNTLLYASPVTAAPEASYFEYLDRYNHSLRRAIHAMMAKLVFLLDEDQFADIEAIALAAGVTPAAPGIDLREIGGVMAEAEKHVETLHSLCPRASVFECIKRLRKAQAALIDASPKGTTLNEQFGSAEGLGSASHYRQVLERIATQGPHYGPDGTRETWKHWSDIARDALVDSPKGDSDGGMAAEYQRWIDFYHAGEGDYADFLRRELPDAFAQASDAEVRP